MRSAKRTYLLFTAIIFIFSVFTIVFMYQYFSYYRQPYMMHEIINLSDGWQYNIESSNTQNTGRRSTDVLTLGTLHGSLKILGGHTMSLYKQLDVYISNAAILIRANHQTVNVYLDDVPMFIDRNIASGDNPGMALHYLLLPKDYLHKTLKIELTSPYDLYAGRTSPILLGTITSLEAYTLSRSMRSVILMAICLLLGFCTITLTFIESLRGIVNPQNLMIGIFALIWALYYVCTEYITFQFFTPALMSIISLGLYFSFQLPLSLFFYFSFQYYRKWMLPAVVLHCSFPIAALTLQFTGVIDLPQLININNILLAGLIYTIVLSVFEACKLNRMMMFATPFLLVAYVSTLYNFSVFYWRRSAVPYSYRDTFLLLIVCVLIYNIYRFFKHYYGKIRESEVLTFQNRTAIENYEQIKDHLTQIDCLKHDMKNHLKTLQVFLENNCQREAMDYLERFAKQTESVFDTVYHDNLLINTVVSKLIDLTKAKNIKVELDLRAEPINISTPDLFNLLSNVIDNALEDCLSIPGNVNRFIHLTIFRREPYFNIICENSRIGKISITDSQFQSTQEDSSHGYGLTAINRITNDYAGIMDTEYTENTFIITIALKDQQTER